jgi:hypothetical protein
MRSYEPASRIIVSSIPDDSANVNIAKSTLVALAELVEGSGAVAQESRRRSSAARCEQTLLGAADELAYHGIEIVRPAQDGRSGVELDCTQVQTHPGSFDRTPTSISRREGVMLVRDDPPAVLLPEPQ